MIDTAEMRAQCAALWESFTPMERRVLSFSARPITEGRLRNKVTAQQEPEMRTALAMLLARGHIVRTDISHPVNGSPVVHYHSPIGAEIRDQAPRATWISGMRDHDQLHFHIGQPCQPLVDSICTAIDYAQSLNIPYSYQIQNNRLTIEREVQ